MRSFGLRGGDSVCAPGAELVATRDDSARSSEYLGRLVRGLSLRTCRAVLSRLLDRSLREGGGWAAALDDLLRCLADTPWLSSRFEQMMARRGEEEGAHG